MKTSILLVSIISFSLAAHSFAQPPGRLDSRLESKVVERGPHHRVWQQVRHETQPDGNTSPRTNGYVELATGMHFLSQGQWLESQEVIEPAPGGAVAHRGPHKVAFAANINTPGAIHLATEDDRRLRSHILGLAYTDAATGRSVLIAELKDSIGEIDRNQVIYRDAFTDFKADVRYTYTAAGLEQDVILREVPPSPADYGFDPAVTRLEIFTEFLDPPTPVRRFGILKHQADPVRRQGMADPDLTDESLDFGSMQIGAGKAFPLSSEGVQGNGEAGVPVGKTWLRIDGRDFLIEKVDYPSVEPHLRRLPKGAGAALRKEPPNAAAVDRPAAGAFARTFPPAPKEVRENNARMRMASVTPPTRGYVLDYALVNSTANYVFKGDTTYYVAGTVNLSGTTVIEGGAVIKYINDPVNARLNIQGPIDCRTSPFRPAVFTAKDDDSIGEKISGSTGVPVNYYASHALLISDSTSTYDLHDLRIRYATEAIYRSAGTARITISHSQILDCNRALSSVAGPIDLRNGLLYRVRTAYYTPVSVNVGEHVTFHGVGTLATNPTPSLLLTNCLIISVTNSVFYTGANNFSNKVDTGIFQVIGGGGHYLANNSTHRNAGATAINPSLAADLKKRTTFPPTLTTAAIKNTTTSWSIRATRDTDTPDRGYHYDPLDHVIRQLTITNSTLTIQAGVAVGVYGASADAGLWLLNGANVISDGSPTNLIRFLRYNLAQEQAVTNWSSPTVGRVLACPYPYSTNSLTTTARFRFTEFSMPPSGNDHFYAGCVNLGLTFRDCELRGGQLTLVRPNVIVTNCLFDRVAVSLTAGLTAFTLQWRDSTFAGGSLNAANTLNGAWQWRDNLFDAIALTQTGTADANYNAYVAGNARFTPNGANDQLLSLSPAYQTGPLGRFYHSASETQLIDRGSRTADAAALFHYTTANNQVKDGFSTVDLGYHYIALPADSDSDGQPDYVEDPNGNGKTDTGENSFVNPVVTLPSGALAYRENDPPTRIDVNATLDDPDSISLNGGTLVVDFSANGQSAEDRLAIQNQGSGAGQIGVSGSTVTYGGTAIGTFVIGGGVTLTVTFNPSSTTAGAMALLRAVIYQNISENPSSLARTLRVVANDGRTGVSTAAFKTINVTPVADAPVVTFIPATLDYIKGLPGVAINTNASVSDADSANFNGGYLQVQITANVQPEDQLGIRHIGTAAGQIGTNITTTTNVTYGGTTIGTLAGGLGTTPLRVVFNANATPVAVSALLTNITFQHNQPLPANTAARQVLFLVSDGNGGLSTPVFKTINIICPTRLEIMLIIDKSGSMAEADGDLPKINNARTAAVHFLDFLGPVADKVGLVAFCLTNNVDAPLGSDKATMTAKINALGTPAAPLCDYTYINDAVNRAQQELMTKHQNGGTPVIILLTDGIYYSGSVNPVVGATAAKNSAIHTRIITIGLRPDNDPQRAQIDATLTQMATSVGDYYDFYSVAQSSHLMEIYDSISQKLCREINLPPIANPDTTNTLEDTILSIPAAFLLGNDSRGGVTESNQTLRVVNVNLPAHGTATFDGVNVTYTSSLNYNGPDSFTYIIEDNGTTQGAPDPKQATGTITVTVNPVNDRPTLNLISDLNILEDAGLQTVSLTGITAGPSDEIQALTITAMSSQTGLIPHPVVNYTSPNAAGSLTFTPRTNVNGLVTITVTVRDNGGILNGGVDTYVRTFLVNVIPVNDRPTLNVLNNITVYEDSGLIYIPLSGVTVGPANEVQNLTVTANSSNPSLIANPRVFYNSTNGARWLSLGAQPNQSGSSTITVDLLDDGGTANGGVNSFSRNFTITVLPVNDPPELSVYGLSPDPVQLGSLSDLNVQDIAMSPDRTTVFVADLSSPWRGLRAINISDSSNPYVTASLETTINRFVLSPNGAFAHIIGSGWQIANVSDPSDGFYTVASVSGDYRGIAVSRDGRTAYLTRPQGLDIFDISDLGNIRLLGQTSIPTTYNSPELLPITLSPDGTKVFVAAGSAGMISVEVSNPYLPGSLSALAGFAVDFAVAPDGTKGYAAKGAAGWGVVNIAPNGTLSAGPTYPLTGSLPPYAKAARISRDGKKLYLADDKNGLRIIDLSIPGSPSVVGTLPTGTQHTCLAVAADDNRAFLGNGPGGLAIVDIGAYRLTLPEDTKSQTINLRVFDLETPAASLVLSGSSSNPSLVPNQNLRLGGAGENRNLLIIPATNASGSTTITLTVQDAQGATDSKRIRLTVTPVNDPPELSVHDLTAKPVLVGTFSNLSSAYGVALSRDGKRAFVAAGGELRIVDLTTDPIHGVVMSYTPTLAFNVTLSPDETKAYVAAGGDGAYIFDVCNPSQEPPYLGYLESYNATQIRVSLDNLTAYVVDAIPDTWGFNSVRIFNVANPASPIQVASIPSVTGWLQDAMLSPDGRTLYIGDEAELRIYDVSVPSNPVFRSQTHIGFADGVFGLATSLDGNTLFLALAGVPIAAMDVHNPANPLFLSPWNTAGYGRFIAMSKDGTKAYLSYWDFFGGNGLSIADVRNPSLPIGRGFLPGVTGRVTISPDERFAYFANTSVGVQVVDISTYLLTIPANTSSQPIALRVTDLETPAASLSMSSASSNPGLIPNQTQNIAFGGGGENRTVTLTPAPNQSGQSTITLTVTDGGGASSSKKIELTVTPVGNLAPVVTLPDPPLNYPIGAGPQLIDVHGTVTDADSLNFDGGNMTISLTANAAPDDLLSIQSLGLNAGEIAVSGDVVTSGGKQIGTFTGGRGTSPLIITFNANATPADAQALLRRVAYRSLSPNPTQTNRIAQVVVSDGDGGTSLPALKQILFQNRPPVVDAGPDQDVTMPAPALLTATASDDGLPVGSTLEYVWTVAFGDPSLVQFDLTPGPLRPRVTFSKATNFVLRLTVTERLSGGTAGYSVHDELSVIVRPANKPPVVNAGIDAEIIVPVPGSGIQLTQMNLTSGAQYGFPGLAYSEASNALVVSVWDVPNAPLLHLIAPNGSVQPFSKDANGNDLNGVVALRPNGQAFETKLAAASDDGGGHSLGGFTPGEVLAGTHSGRIYRFSPSGINVPPPNGGPADPWVTLPLEEWDDNPNCPRCRDEFRGNPRHVGGLTFDRTGNFDGDLLVGTYGGSVWRIKADGTATRLLAGLPGNYSTIPLQAICVVSNDTLKYGPLAGKVVVANALASQTGPTVFYAIDPQGRVFPHTFRLPDGQAIPYPDSMTIIPPNHHFYGVNRLSASGDGANEAWTAPASGFEAMVGDILVAEQFGGGVLGLARLYRIHWNGSAFQVSLEAVLPSTRPHWEAITFAPMQATVLPTPTYLLQGMVSDDGLPPDAPLSVSWSQISGPGAVTFANPNLTQTTATFGSRGLYQLRLSADDTQYRSSDDVIIAVKSASTFKLTPGAIQRKAGGSVTLTATLYDGFGEPAAGQTVRFSFISGPNSRLPQDILTDAEGVALFTYSGANVGTDRVQASLVQNPEALPAPQSDIVWDTPAGPTIEVRVDNVVISEGQSVDFGTVLWPVVKTFGITNIGPVGIDLDSIGLGIPNNGFVVLDMVDPGQWYAVLFPGQGTSFRVAFDPNSLTATGPKSTSLVFHQFISTHNYILTANYDQTDCSCAPPLVGLQVRTAAPYLAGATLDLEANASTRAAGPAITKIEFYATGDTTVKLGEVFIPPPPSRDSPHAATARFAWSGVPAGTFDLRAIAYQDDGAAASSIPVMVVVARPNNTPPNAVDDRLFAGADATRRIDVLKNDYDADGDRLRITGVTSPTARGGTATLAAGGRSISYTPAPGVTGPDSFTYTISDGYGGSDSATVNMTIFSNEELWTEFVLTISITSPLGTNEVTGPVDILGRADVFKVSNGAPRPDKFGYYKLEHKYVGDASAPYVEFAFSNTPVYSGGPPLGTLNTKNLANGLYEIRLTAAFISGETISIETYISVGGGMKPGHFTMDYMDLEMPVIGIPIALSRSYDSRDDRRGDFGYGWQSGLSSIRLQKNMPLGDNWQGYNGGLLQPFCIADAGPHLITIELPGGQMERFHPVAKLVQVGGARPCYPAAPSGAQVVIDFEPLRGTFGKLEAIGLPNDLEIAHPLGDYDGPVLIGQSQEDETPFDTDNFKYTSRDGRVFIFGAGGKLLSVRDLNNNQLTIDANGVRHSSGKSILFIRDHPKFNVITRIYDPLGLNSSGNPTGPPVLKYDYDVLGNLVRVHRLQNRSGAGTYYTSEYHYNSTALPHLATEVLDARGITSVRNFYDDQGRLERTLDAGGKELDFRPLDVTGRTQTITERDSHGTLLRRTVHTYDERGNITQTRVTDTNDRLVTENRRSYGDPNNPAAVTAETDPFGKSKTYSYAANGLTQTVADEMGHTTEVLSYNKYGQPKRIYDPRRREIPGNVLPPTEDYEYEDGDDLGGLFEPETGDLARSTDALGNYTKFTYDRGAVETEQAFDARGTPGNEGDDIELSYMENHYFQDGDSDGFLEWTKVWGPADVGGNRILLSKTSHAYDANGNEILRTMHALDANGVELLNLAQVTEFEYDGEERLTRTIRHVKTTPPVEDYISQTEYNALGKPAAETDELGRVTRYYYDSRGNPVQTTYPDGTIMRTVYDADHRPIYVQDRHRPIDPALLQTDPCDDSTGVADPDRMETASCGGTHTIYDAGGQDVRVERVKNLRIARVDSGGVSETTKTDCPGCAVVVIFTTTQYDLAGRPEQSTDGNGHTTYFTHDDAGRLRAEYRYDEQNNPLVTTHEYDANGNETRVIDRNGIAIDRRYDASDQLWRVEFPTTVVVSPGLAPGVPAPADTYQEMTYDGLGRKIQERNPAGILNQFQYDHAGRLITVTNAVGTADQAITRYQYDSFGNVIEQKSARTDLSAITTFEYDKLNRRTKRTLPSAAANGPAETTEYIRDGAAVKVLHRKTTDFNGKVMFHVHDVANRLVAEVEDNVLNPATVSYTYASTGQRKSMTDPSCTPPGGGAVVSTRYYYDSNSRLTEKKTIQGNLVYTYDNNGKVATINSRNPDGSARTGASVTYTYNRVDQLWKVTDHRLPAANKDTVYQYDFNGNVETCTYPNTVSSACGYDDVNRLTSLNVRKGLAAPFASYVYTLGGAGNRVQLDELGGRVIGYTYDSRYRLRRENIQGGPAALVGSVDYGYDAAGNRLSRAVAAGGGATLAAKLANTSRTYNHRDQPNGGSFSFDLNGNTKVEPIALPSPAVQPTGGNPDLYDFDNRLTNRGGGAVQFVYDGDGNRVRKTVVGVTTYYLVDELNPTGSDQVIEELPSPNGNPAVIYTYGNSLISRKDSSTSRFYVYDGHGSVRFLTQGAWDVSGAPTATCGDVSDTYTYDAFGVLLAQTGPTPNNYLYAGEQFDPDLGLYYNRARYMNPDTDRFWTIDTFEGNQEDPASLHLYLYAHANPVNGNDPSGHEFSLIGVNISAALNQGLEVMKDTAAAEIKWEMRDLQKQLLNDYIPRDLPYNQKIGLAGEKVWVNYLVKKKISAVRAKGPVSAVGPDLYAARVANGRLNIYVGEVKASKSKIPGVGALKWNIENGCRQMSARWLDTYASSILQGMIDLGIQEITKGSKEGKDLTKKLLKRKSFGLYLMAGFAKGYTSEKWRIRGFRLLHDGNRDIDSDRNGDGDITADHTVNRGGSVIK